MASLGNGKISALEKDSIGEILNISMGAAATTLSEIIGKKVSITTPRVDVFHSSKIQVEAYEPALGVEINYDKGILGKNVMVLKNADVRKILEILLGGQPSGPGDALDELATGAMAEIMNQMMGASATSLSSLLDRTISITPPSTFSVEGNDQLRRKYFLDEQDALVTVFKLNVEGVVDSDFVIMMAFELARELISAFAFVNSDAAEEAPPAPPELPAPVYEVGPVQYPSFDGEPAPEEKSDNLNLILAVPLEITVEIGQAKKTIRDVLEFAPGMVIELNKQVGSQVDVYVNGKAIAKGDVVVVDEHYGVRITEVPAGREIIDRLT